MKHEIDKLLAESQIREIEKVIDQTADVESSELKELRGQLKKLKEEITAGDWGRIGVIAGLLWYKLDTVISTLKSIERNTSKL